MKLNATKLGLAGGILWGACMFICTFIAIAFPLYAVSYFEMLQAIYPGYSISVAGAFIGLAYGFADGFIGLFLLGWLYNKLSD